MFTVLVLSLPTYGASLTGQVLNVEGGASLVLDTGAGKHRRVLLLGIVAPLSGTRLHHQAGKQLHMLLAGKFVTVVYNELTASGDIVGQVLHGGRDVNHRMLESGLVRLDADARFGPDTLREYRAAQKRAQGSGLGIWRLQFTPRP